MRTADSRIRLVVYDVLGQEVAVLADGRFPAGKFRFTFDGTHFSSGVYFYRLTSGSFTAAKGDRAGTGRGLKRPIDTGRWMVVNGRNRKAGLGQVGD